MAQLLNVDAPDAGEILHSISYMIQRLDPATVRRVWLICLRSYIDRC